MTGPYGPASFPGAQSAGFGGYAPSPGAAQGYAARGPGLPGPPPGPFPQAPRPRRNGPAVAALVYALCGACIVPIPYIGAPGLLFGLAGFVLALVGLNSKRFGPQRRAAVVAAPLSVLVLIAGALNFPVWRWAYAEMSSTPVQVILEANSSSPVDVSYQLRNHPFGTDTPDFNTSAAVFDHTGDFSVSYEMHLNNRGGGSGTSGSARIEVAAPGDGGGTASCRILVDGRVVHESGGEDLKYGPTVCDYSIPAPG
ncbi:MAG: hypothetical protein Q4E05_04745 [Pseudoclavibacter sp.]|nr:hypothetical protein [Pseudoclavibacter sp.]